MASQCTLVGATVSVWCQEATPSQGRTCSGMRPDTGPAGLEHVALEPMTVVTLREISMKTATRGVAIG